MKCKILMFICLLFVSCTMVVSCHKTEPPIPADTTPSETETGDIETGDIETGDIETGDIETDGPTSDGVLTFKTFDLDGRVARLEVLPSTERFSLQTEIEPADGVTFIVSKTEDGTELIPEKVVSLNTGTNIFYVIADTDSEKITYVVEIYRKKLVNVQISDGNKVIYEGTIMEGEKIPVPEIEDQIGKTFIGWDHEVKDVPIYSDKEDLVINAKWEIDTEMSDFDFVSSSTSCIITGTKETTASTVVIPETVTGIGDNAFSRNENITSIEIPDSVKSIGFMAFHGCSNLSNVVLPDGLTEIGNHAFSGCDSLVSIGIPNSVKTIGADAFSRCKNLSSVIIPAGVTKIGGAAFYGCTSLKSITLPSGISVIDISAFQSSGIENIVIPNGVSSIGFSAFMFAESLTEINIPVSVNTIKANAFKGSGLTTINYAGTTDQWKSIGITANYIADLGVVTINCSDGTLTAEYEEPVETETETETEPETETELDTEAET